MRHKSHRHAAHPRRPHARGAHRTVQHGQRPTPDAALRERQDRRGKLGEQDRRGVERRVATVRSVDQRHHRLRLERPLGLAPASCVGAAIGFAALGVSAGSAVAVAERARQAAERLQSHQPTPAHHREACALAARRKPPDGTHANAIFVVAALIHDRAKVIVIGGVIDHRVETVDLFLKVVPAEHRLHAAHHRALDGTKGRGDACGGATGQAALAAAAAYVIGRSGTAKGSFEGAAEQRQHREVPRRARCA